MPKPPRGHTPPTHATSLQVPMNRKLNPLLAAALLLAGGHHTVRAADAARPKKAERAARPAAEESAARIPPDLQVVKDVVFKRVGDVALDLKKSPLVVYIHGGGWGGGDKFKVLLRDKFKLEADK